MSNDNVTTTSPIKPGPRQYDSKVPPLDWRPEPSAGVVLTGPTTALSWKEYDAFAAKLIADHAGDPDAIARVQQIQKRGGVLERDGVRAYTRGRL